MAWQIRGRYFGTCSCELMCPCTASPALGERAPIEGRSAFSTSNSSWAA